MHQVTHLPALIQYVVPFLHRYGYFAIFLGVLFEDFGVPVPGETILVAASILAGQHVFRITDVEIVGAGCGFCFYETGQFAVQNTNGSKYGSAESGALYACQILEATSTVADGE
jgi:membrane protein YqaA with SNARE-associated domain